MTGFPRLPLSNGDNDEDISLHLHTQIGPSAPLPSKKTNQDEEMLRLLNDDYNSQDDNDFNKYFRIYQRTGKINLNEHDEDEDEANSINNDNQINDDNEPETEDEEEDEYKPPLNDSNIENYNDLNNSKTEKPNSMLFNEFKKAQVNQSSGGGRSGVILYSTIAFVIAFGFTLVVLNIIPSSSVSLADGVYNGLSKRINNLESGINTLSQDQDKLKSQIEALAMSSREMFSSINIKIKELEGNTVNSETLKHIRSEYQKITEKVAKFDDFEITLDVDSKLNELNKKLDNLKKINDDINYIKDEVIGEFISSLSDNIPIYINNTDKTMHISSEFQKYVYKITEESINNKAYNWKRFLEENESNLKDYISKNVKTSTEIKNINKTILSELIKSEFNALTKEFENKFNQKIDTLPIAQSNVSTEMKLENIKTFYLDNLLDIFTKGSLRANYADYNLGARILGFLTNSGYMDNKSFLRKVFLGWFDFLNTNGLKSTKHWKFNANNVLLDNSRNWECGSNYCTLGIRLSSPAILTDIVIKTPIEKATKKPVKASLFYKTTNSHYEKLVNYYNNLKFNFASNTNNKYLKNFVKIKEIEIYPGTKVIELPKLLINERIPVKDLYIEMRSEDNHIELNHIQMYGINEFNSYKYSEEFQNIINDISRSENYETGEYDNVYEMYNDRELGTDEKMN